GNPLSSRALGGSRGGPRGTTRTRRWHGRNRLPLPRPLPDARVPIGRPFGPRGRTTWPLRSGIRRRLAPAPGRPTGRGRRVESWTPTDPRRDSDSRAGRATRPCGPARPSTTLGGYVDAPGRGR